MNARQQPASEILPLQPRPLGYPIPLTATQLHWWKRASTAPPSIRSVAIAVRLLGALDSELLRACFAAVTRRHESLRTKIVVIDGIPRQHVDDAMPEELQFIDLSATAMSDAQSVARGLAEALAAEEIELSKGPLFKAALSQLSRNDHVLALTADHIIADAASMEILVQELVAAYEQELKLELPKPRIQFGDYAVWQEQSFPAWRRQHELFWREYLNGAPRIQLRTDLESADSGRRTTAMKHVFLGKRLSTELQQVAQREGVSVPLVVLAVYLCFMSRWCNERDLVIKFVSHGRHQDKDLKNMVGFLANVMHLRVRLADDDSFANVLKKVRQALDTAFEHYDFDRVLHLIPEFTTELYFNWLPTGKPIANKPTQSDGDVGIRLQRFNLGMTWQGKLWPFFFETPAGIAATIAYRPDLFLPSTLERFGQQLRALAHALMRHPTTSILALPKEGTAPA